MVDHNIYALKTDILQKTVFKCPVVLLLNKQAIQLQANTQTDVIWLTNCCTKMIFSVFY